MNHLLRLSVLVNGSQPCLMKNWIIFLFAFFPAFIFGQLKRDIHQPFAISDTIKIITVNFPEADSLSVQFWPSNNGMMELNVEMVEANEAILKYAIEKGRYEILPKKNGEILALTYKQVKRPAIETKMGTVGETIQLKLFLPDSFKPIKKGEYKRE